MSQPKLSKQMKPIMTPLIILSGGTPDYATSKNGNKSISIDILQPETEIMTREEIPPLPTCYYGLFYLFIVCCIPLYISAIYIWSWWFYNSDESWVWLQIIKGIINGVFMLSFNWFNGAIFRDYLGIKANYTRKLSHFTFFTLPYVIDANIGELEPVISNMFVFYNFQLWIMCTIIPTRKFLNKFIDYKKSKYKYLNFGEFMLHAMERSEDRPNTLLWMETQIVLMGVFLLPLTFWWQYLNKPYLILIPQIVNGLGDGLAEPIGVKFGKNHQYKTTACCSKKSYVRSFEGSSMVYFSAVIALVYVYIVYSEYTMWQFIITLITLPIIAAVVEAKAPHTLDNPFISLFVGIAATLPLYIDI